MAEYTSLKSIFGEFFSRLKTYFATRFVDLNANTTVIPEGVDLNSYLTPGTYFCTSNTVAKTLKNCPYTNSNFKLIVNKNSGSSSSFYGTQTLIPGSSSVATIYNRGHNGTIGSSSSFSSWVELVPSTRTINGKALSGNIDIMFPDYSSALKTVAGTLITWTATQDCYVLHNTISVIGSYELVINNVAVDFSDFTTINGQKTFLNSFNGYVKKGDVVKGAYWKAYALR